MAIVKKRIPGFQDGGSAVEPTTGNDVPIGSLPNEVADDIPARLSEGEFVLPADVVRFIGLERLMKLRDEAKEGLRRMAEVGQMGNAEEVGKKAEESFEEEEDTSKFESDIDEILSEVESPEGQTEQAFAEGGVVGQPWIAGTDLKKAPKNPVFDVRYYRHSDGRLMYITFFNGKPMMPIPEGFTPTDKPVEQQIGKEVETKRPEGPSETGTGYGGEAAPTTGGPDVSAISKGDMSSLQMGTTVSPGAVKGAAAAVGMVTGLPFGLAFMGDKAAQKAADALTMASGKAAGSQNIEAVGKAFGIDTSTTEGKAAASSLIDSGMGFMGGKTATTGAEGTGGAASRAGAEAAAQVGQLGLSPSAQGQASQQAANAVIAGADPSTAVSNAVDAAVNAAQGGSTVGVDALGPGGTEGFGGGYGSDAGFGDGSGLGYKKGGLVSKPVKASKKYKGKGLAAR